MYNFLGGNMASNWKKAAKGIRYREHESRKHGIKFDRYFALSYWLDGKTISEGVGWASDGVTQTYCEEILRTLKLNQKSGTGAQTFKAMRQAEIAKAMEEQKQEQKEQATTLQGIFEGGYMAAQIAKDAKSLKAEVQLMKNHIVPYFNDTPLRDITTSMMDLFLQHMAKKKSKHTGNHLSPRTIQYTLAVMRQIWNYALSRGLTDTPYPAKQIKAPTEDNKRTRYLQREEAEQLLEILKTRSQTTHDLALLSLFCGLRAGELFKLQWADINFEQGFIHIRDRKNKDSGTAWITPRLKAMLENRYKGQSGQDFVFPSTKGEQKSFTSKLFSKVVDELGLNDNIADKRDKIVFHSLRHTYASWLAQKGVPLHSLAGLMGHKTTTMTQRYAHLSPEVQQKHAMLIDDTPPQAANVIPFDKAK